MPRVSVNLSETVVSALRRIAEKHEITLTEALRRAISTEAFLDEALEDGSKLLLQDQSKKLREVVFQR